MKIISLVIPVFNGLDYTKKCIANLHTVAAAAGSEEYSVNLVIVDDGSHDGTSDWIKSQSFRDVYLLKGDGNLWWSGGVNVGVKYALKSLQADYIILWNNDVTAHESYFTELFRLLNSEQSYRTIYGSKIFTDSGLKTIWSMGGVFNPYSGKKFMLGMFARDSGEFQKPVHVDWLPGMGTVIPVSVIEKIGYWDAANFPQYHGDSDFTYRAKLNNFDIVVCPQLKIWNDTTNTGIRHNLSFSKLYRQLFDIKSNYNIRKNLIFYRKYSKSIRAYAPLLKAYGIMIGGFVKWKILSLFNIRKKVAV
jgi:GT2 family glycosyltransferase